MTKLEMDALKAEQNLEAERDRFERGETTAGYVIAAVQALVHARGEVEKERARERISAHNSHDPELCFENCCLGRANTPKPERR